MPLSIFITWNDVHRGTKLRRYVRVEYRRENTLFGLLEHGPSMEWRLLAWKLRDRYAQYYAFLVAGIEQMNV